MTYKYMIMYSKIYWIDKSTNFLGSLGIMARPRGNDWLKGELRWLKLRGVDCLVSLLESSEAYELGLSCESDLCRNHEIEFINYQIEDVNTPKDSDSFIALVKSLAGRIKKTEKVVIHCRMGIGRSSMLAAAILIHIRFDERKVFKIISKSRGMTVPDTDEQIEWIQTISSKLK